MTIDSLINKYSERVPYEERGREYEKERKRKERARELKEITDDLISECSNYKRLRLTPHQKNQVHYMVEKFSNNFNMFHKTAKSEAIILAFIFYLKINENPLLKLKEYKITSKYCLTDNMFEIIICKLASYYMKRMPIIPVGTTNYDHEILSRNGGEI